MEEALLKLDGSRVEVEVSAVPFVYRGEHGALVFAQDITERRRADNMLHARLRLFEFTEQHILEEVLTKTLDEVCRLTESPIGFYHFVDAHEAALTLQAWSTNTKQEHCKVEGQGMHNLVAEAGVWADCLRSRKPVIHNDYASLLHRKGLPEGHAPLVRDLVTPIFRHEKIVAVLGIGNKARDYTEKDIEIVNYFADVAWEIARRKRAEEEIRELNAELEERVDERTRQLSEAQEHLVRQEKLATLGQLAGGVGHELRNPLGVIHNAVYFLRMIQPEVEEKVEEYLSIIESEVRTANKIINDLLNYGRSKSVNIESVSVYKLADDALARLPPSEGITVTRDLPDRLPLLRIDLQQVVQVLGNLLVNAYQAMPNGGKVMLSAQQVETNMLSISIRDTGPGILPENMERLFEPLFTTKTRGIGLGLAVSRRLIEANGGRVEVHSEMGEGSTFIVVLPTEEVLL